MSNSSYWGDDPEDATEDVQSVQVMPTLQTPQEPQDTQAFAPGQAPGERRYPRPQMPRYPQPQRPPTPQSHAQLRSRPPAGAVQQPHGKLNLDFTLFFNPQNRAYLAVTISGIVAVIAFFMPYFTVSTTTTATPTFLNIPLVQATPLPTTGSEAANGFGLLWLVLLAALVIIAVATVLVLDTGLLDGLTPLVGSIVFLVGSVVSCIILLFAWLRASGDVSQATHTLNLRAATNYQVILGVAPGFWLTLLAMLVIIGVNAYRLYRLW